MLNYLHLLLIILLFQSLSNCISVDELVILRGEKFEAEEDYVILEGGVLSIVDFYGDSFTLEIHVSEESTFFFTATLPPQSDTCSMKFSRIGNLGKVQIDAGTMAISDFEVLEIVNYGEIIFSNFQRSQHVPSINYIVNRRSLVWESGPLRISTLENPGQFCLGSGADVEIESLGGSQSRCIQLLSGSTLTANGDMKYVDFSPLGGSTFIFKPRLSSTPVVSYFGGDNVVIFQGWNASSIDYSYEISALKINVDSKVYELEIGFNYDPGLFKVEAQDDDIIISYPEIPPQAFHHTCDCNTRETNVPGTLPTISTQTTGDRTRTFTITTSDDRWTTISDSDPEPTTSEPDSTNSESGSTASEPESTATEPESTASESPQDSATSESESTMSETDSTISEPESSTSELGSTAPDPESKTSEPEPTTSEDSTTPNPESTSSEEEESTSPHAESIASETYITSVQESTTSELESATSGLPPTTADPVPPSETQQTSPTTTQSSTKSDPSESTNSNTDPETRPSVSSEKSSFTDPLSTSLSSLLSSKTTTSGGSEDTTTKDPDPVKSDSTSGDIKTLIVTLSPETSVPPSATVLPIEGSGSKVVGTGLLSSGMVVIVLFGILI
ncbi:uncharacterized protein J8A68_000110 [[Candida] subhashii]|uniref:Hyphally-regulated cell wall protein N-terminal domain-containing protein n=1 Tax=[Candida] subhashii TaxID=561895 RepID=A0A8J5V3Y3_9ASCO|nr:uncharacterized protein J8A68_000110 [[Candida] subhashii]KAG7666365.1 hypothetical protein J8A68_000110 [[Candida] subhashii]